MWTHSASHCDGRDNLKAVEMLLEYDADASLTDDKGKTALDVATFRLGELEQQWRTVKKPKMPQRIHQEVN